MAQCLGHQIVPSIVQNLLLNCSPFAQHGFPINRSRAITRSAIPPAIFQLSLKIKHFFNSTLAWPLRHAWVAQGPPKPNPKQAEGRKTTPKAQNATEIPLRHDSGLVKFQLHKYQAPIFFFFAILRRSRHRNQRKSRDNLAQPIQ
jgi:hypothetical protein